MNAQPQAETAQQCGPCSRGQHGVCDDNQTVPCHCRHDPEKGEIDGVRVGTLWRRNEGREVVRIERAWLYGWPDPEPTVRAHPTHGGRPLVAPTAYLREHYTEVSNA